MVSTPESISRSSHFLQNRNKSKSSPTAETKKPVNNESEVNQLLSGLHVLNPEVNHCHTVSIAEESIGVGCIAPPPIL